MKPGVSPQALFTEEEIREAVRQMAAAIRRDYEGKDLLAVGVLKGSFVFLADLIRSLDRPVEVDFVWLSSYGNRRFTSGEVRIKKDLETPIAGRHVLIVEDIVDTGRLLLALISQPVHFD